MPGVDGFELAHRVRERCGSERPLLIAVTGCQGDATRGAEECFDLIVTKPADSATLAGVLRRLERPST
jgi:CheY-like chemotaxis protein